ncbi:hypothetical protein LCGC14_0902680 [marine sediment metagenome]|uniref:Peptidase S26 domain-containing protein n=1 Tax=marine sediment metagenome TaxID=412755 RepID=A0A0F9S2U4_9ZZZZ
MKSKEKPLKSLKQKIVSVFFVISFSAAGIFLIYFILQVTLNTQMPIVVAVSGSMEPTHKSGDLLFLKGIDPENIKVSDINDTNGDIIVYNAINLWDNAPKTPIAHRVVDKWKTSSGWFFLTKGDANSDVDVASIPETRIIGVVWGRIPYIGIIFTNVNYLILIIIIIITPFILIPIVKTIQKHKNKLVDLNPFLRTYLLELRVRWKRVLFFSIISVVFALLFSSHPPYDLDRFEFFRSKLTYFRFFIIFASCFFFSDIVSSEFAKQTCYIPFPKINKYKLIGGKYIANLSIIILLVILYYLMLNISVMVIYDAVILESYISLGLAIIYTITLSAIILFFSTIIPKVNLTIIIIILIYFLGFPVLEQFLAAINPEIEPIFSLNYIGNLIHHVIPGSLPVGQRWLWVYTDIFNPVKVWLFPAIEVGILIMSFYSVLLFLFTLLALKGKEFV